MIEDDDDDFDDQTDFIPMEDRVGTRRKRRTKFVLPSQFGGNNATDIVWTNEEDQDFTADELLALAMQANEVSEVRWDIQRGERT